MTYQNVTERIREILTSHAMLRMVLFNSPQEWLKSRGEYDLPICCFTVNTGSFEPGLKTFNVDFWFLDKSGAEAEFETYVASDMLEVANDILSKLSQSHIYPWTTELVSNFEIISDRFEDYLAGVKMSVTIKTVNKYDACSFPSNS